MKHRIFPLGERAVTVDLGGEISFALNDRVLRLARFFDRNSFAGLIETVPAYSSLTVFYDVFIVRKNYPQFSTACAAVKHFVEKGLKNLPESQASETREIRIPVCFDADFALDLAFVAAEKNLSPAEVIEIFLGRTYRVFMLGFLPGFSYMGKVDARIEVERKRLPRRQVAAGSVGIAGVQTGIYSLESPGGWQIIGKTPLRLFAPDAENPAFLQAGDTVKFYAVDSKTFSKLSEAQFNKE